MNISGRVRNDRTRGPGTRVASSPGGAVPIMKTTILRRVFLAISSTLALVVTPVGRAQELTSALPIPEATWYGSAEAFLLQLDHGANGNTPVILNSVSGATLLGTNDLTYSMQAGPKLVLGRAIGDAGAAEVVYFGLNDWNVDQTVFGSNDLRIPGDLGLSTFDFFNVDQLTAAQSATLNNVEANIWRRINDGPVCVMAGFRYFQLNENFSISGQDTDTGASTYAIRTANDLYGAQIGGRYRDFMGATRRFGIEAAAKAGLFGNAAGMSQYVSDFDNTFVVRDTNINADRVAFVGDIGLTGLIRVTDNVNARIGYSLIWAEGVARAANQLDFSDNAASGTQIAYGQGAFLQGINIGFEFGW